MKECKYVIVGGSHAGLSAADSIRLFDSEGSITLVNREDRLPYSPTILPYILSGAAEEGKIYLRDQVIFKSMGIDYVQGSMVDEVDPSGHLVRLSTGERLRYEKLLLATGASPERVPIEGLEGVSYHVLRTLDHALRLREETKEGRAALIIGAGLVGMHAAESMCLSGLRVTVVEAEPIVLPGAFDSTSGRVIQDIYESKGVRIILSNKVSRVREANGKIYAELSSGEGLSADILLLAAGVAPNVECLKGEGIEVDKGILVDEKMRTSAEDVWAAGDVAQAKDLFLEGKRLNATLPDAVEQGRIAGMDMAGASSLKDYQGGISMHVFRFFGNRAVSLGTVSNVEEREGVEVDQVSLPGTRRYMKLVLDKDRLIGVAGINADMDPGIMREIIARRIELGEKRRLFIERPQEAGRMLMTASWR